jgi:hypothetical protein
MQFSKKDFIDGVIIQAAEEFLKYAKDCKILLEPISKIRLGFRARRETEKKRSIHVVCEHFEPFRNAAMGT